MNTEHLYAYINVFLNIFVKNYFNSLQTKTKHLFRKEKHVRPDNFKQLNS